MPCHNFEVNKRNSNFIIMANYKMFTVGFVGNFKNLFFNFYRPLHCKDEEYCYTTSLLLFKHTVWKYRRNNTNFEFFAHFLNHFIFVVVLTNLFPHKSKSSRVGSNQQTKIGARVNYLVVHHIYVKTNFSCSFSASVRRFSSTSV